MHVEGRRPPLVVVLQGLASSVLSQLRLVEALEQQGARPDAVHATSSGALASLHWACVRAAPDRRAPLCALEAPMRAVFLQPWLWGRLLRRLREVVEPFVAAVGEERMDRAVRSLCVHVYSYDRAGGRHVARPEGWSALLDDFAHAANNPFVTCSSTLRLDGVSVRMEELRRGALAAGAAQVWSSAFPTAPEIFFFALGPMEAAHFSSPLRRISLDQRWSSFVDVAHEPAVLWLRATFATSQLSKSLRWKWLLALLVSLVAARRLRSWRVA
jgi:hypothetical protein